MSRRSVAAVVLILLGVVAPAAAAPGAAAIGTTASAVGTVDHQGTLTYRLALTPDEPGEIEVTVIASIPDSVRRLRIDLGSRKSVTAARGFRATDDSERSWEWDESTPEPTLTYTVDVDRTNANVEGLDTTDAGPWALVALSDAVVGYQYWYVGGTEATFERAVQIEGEGWTGEHLAYLGPSEQFERATNEEAFVLIVPTDAEVNESPDEILTTLSTASDRLLIGGRRSQVNAFAVPYQLRRGGLAVGGDFWVSEDMPIADPDNVWVHEYVHTRQRFETTPETRWITEASAEYYAALLTWRQGRIDYEEFASHLQSDRHFDAELARPETWEGPMVPYTKGQRVLAALDVEIRDATDGRASFQTVFRRLNEHDGPVTDDDLADAIAAVADRRYDRWLDRYVRSDGVPSLPDDPSAFAGGDEGPVLATRYVEFSVRGVWTNEPEVVPAGVPVAVRYVGDERVVVANGTNATVLADGSVRLSGDRSTITVRSAAEPSVSVDGLSNAPEVAHGTEMWIADTDGDDLLDGPEVHEHGTNPLSADTDGDGLSDGAEVERYGTDPLEMDTDGDGLSDGDEVNEFGTNPLSTDTDGDGYADGRELTVGTDPIEPTLWWEFTLVRIVDHVSGWLG